MRYKYITKIENIFDKKKTPEGLLSKKIKKCLSNSREYCSIAFPPEVFTANNTSSKASAPKLHRGDKVYIWKNEL